MSSLKANGNDSALDSALEVVPANKTRARFPKGYFFSVGLGIVLLLIIVGLGIVLSQRSFRVVRVGSVVFTANDTPEVLTAELSKLAQTYTLHVQYPDGESKQFGFEDFGLEIDIPASVSTAQQSQKPRNILARAQWWGETSVPLALHINDKKFEKALQNSVTRSSKKPTNAKISVKNGRAKIIAEKTGIGFTVTGGRDVILNAVKSMQTSPLQATDQELSPSITQTEAKPVYEKVKTILAQDVVLNIDNRRVSVPAAAIGRWIELTPVPSAKTIDLSVNSGKVLKYINDVSAPYVQPPRSEVVLKQANGTTKVLVPGKSGVDVVQKNELAKNVAKKVLAGEGISASAAIDYAPFKRINAKSYPKWLVVDVTNKRMYAYENTRLVKTFLISAGAPGTPTVLGQYAIRSKVRIQDMRGNNVDGSRYFQPDVEYINYFYADYAIHGNYWRPASYFGNVNSSHGCVGIRNNDAAWVYAWAPIGTPVIIHS